VVTAYFAIQILLIVVSVLLPRSNRVLCVVSACLLAAGAAMRTGGFDYQNYLDTVADAHGTSTLAAELLVVKDPLMIAVINFCGVISDGARPVFVTMAILAVLPKMIVAQKLDGRSTLFLGLYAILLAPGLEFEAMRAAVALGLLMLLLSWHGKSRLVRWGIGVTSILAHVTAGPFLISRWLTALRGRVLVGVLPLLFALISFCASPMLALFPRAADYQNNVGTAHGFLPPFATYLAYLLSAGSVSEGSSSALVRSANAAAAIAIGFGIGFVPVSVTVAFRFLEFGWVFLALVLTARMKEITWREGARFSYHAAALVWLLMIIGIANSMRHVMALPV
jgi:EpsG family